MLRRFRRHSIHLCDILSKISQPKGITNSRLDRFLKVQNIVLNRLNLFRAQKYVNQAEIDYLHKKRRKSWTGGSESVQLLTLILRQTIHESDLKILEKNQDTSSIGSSKAILYQRVKDTYPMTRHPLSRLGTTVGGYSSSKNVLRYFQILYYLGASLVQLQTS